MFNFFVIFRCLLRYTAVHDFFFFLWVLLGVSAAFTTPPLDYFPGKHIYGNQGISRAPFVVPVFMRTINSKTAVGVAPNSAGIPTQYTGTIQDTGTVGRQPNIPALFRTPALVAANSI